MPMQCIDKYLDLLKFYEINEPTSETGISQFQC